MNFYTDNENLSFYLHHPEMDQVVAVREKNFAEAGQHPEAPADAAQAVSQYEMALNLLGSIAGEVIAPNAEAVDHEGPTLEGGRVHYAPGTRRNLDALIQSGLYGISLERRFNGLNFPRAVVVMAAEMIARADVGFATIWGLTDCADTIQEFGSEALKEKYLPRICQGATCSMDLTEPDAGSDLQSVRLKATYDEAAGCWRLNGVKRFITNGDADLHLVLARSEEGSNDGRGLSYFVFDKADGGMTVRRIENKMGIKGSPTCELQFTNAPCQIVGERRLGLIKYVMSLMNGARLGVAAQSIGLCEAACREAEAYAASREQFGHPINQFIAVQDLLSQMRARTDGARSLMYETARYVDLATTSRPASRIADILTPLVKLNASEFANQCAYDCIQVHGGSGFMKEYACERLYRDARILSIYEGTSQLQVVAAMKGIANGAYLKQIDSYEARVAEALAGDAETVAGTPVAELKHCLDVLRKATEAYKRLYELATVDGTTSDRFEHMTRALTVVLSDIIMGYLLLLDSLRDARFLASCRYFVRQSIGQVTRHIAVLENY
ncbi:MAG: acyl-CoA dehydrogenase family protein [Bacteroidales bacterium]|nr:acyl-CoA dehydrogenase family protein [Bacteroidales bacterium]